MNKQSYISFVCKAAAEYESLLLGRNILFIGRNNKTGVYSCIEAGFEKRHFMHLTGLKGENSVNSEQFFDLCLRNRLRIADVRTFPTGQSELKIRVLANLMKIPYTARVMGRYNNSGDMLVVEDIAGNASGCIGFGTQEDLPYMVPKTILNVNSVQVVIESQQVIATYGKLFNDMLYPTTPLYVAKNLAGKSLCWPEEIAAKIALSPDDIRA